MVGPSVAATPTATRPARRLANPTATATSLSNRYFTLLMNKDVPGLKRFLSPAFQVQRADGSSAEKKDFLAKLPVINKFELTDMRGTQAGGTLIVRYLATVEGTVNGRPYTPGPAPRLATYAWNGTRWQIAANANFNPLKG
ncbi:MAG: nuclear transport factor 2 family protein [Actinobacteria bacterium]|nr:nuclear transport factor 2 family protein [Actinomycetota bacterium]